MPVNRPARDVKGVPIAIGDPVVYATQWSHHAQLKFGKVERVEWEDDGLGIIVLIRKDDTGNLARVRRLERILVLTGLGR